ncbi:hypothetical protein NA57DRAFT_15735, partial [Rhizodiscina lignyota]
DANHIFNAIHSSLRQFPSSLKHNGMSVFLASVPAGSPFYHGGSSPDPITGMEWLAFEPEHAMMFARFFSTPPLPSTEQRPLFSSSSLLRGEEHPLLALMDDEKPPGPPGGGPPGERPPGKRPKRPRSEPGWLHTYRTKHDLRLLYVDGMGAGKTANGTLDTQDYLLLLGSHGSHPKMWDIERGEALCALADKDWNGKIDGFLRMEAGFEIILCDFERHLDTIYVERVNDYLAEDALEPEKEALAADVWFNYWRAIVDRFHGFPPGRAKVYYDEFVTAYGHGFDLHSEDESKPRLLNVSQSDLELLRANVDDLVFNSDTIFYNVHEWFDWQSTVDYIVTRYASRLEYLTSPRYAESQKYLHHELRRTLNPFIDNDNRAIPAEIERCTSHFLPNNSYPHPLSASFVENVITSVSRSVCERLFTALESSDPKGTGAGDPYKELRELMAYLNWTVWKECGQCAVDELCVVPVWPFGALEDHERPSCHNATVGFSQRGYWGNG